MSSSSPTTLLIVANDTFPSFRVDNVILFSRFLSRDLSIDWVMRTKDAVEETPPEKNGERYYLIGRGSFWYPLNALPVHVSRLRAILAGRYGIVQCRDTIVVSAVYAIAARLANRPFVYWMSFPMVEGYRHVAKTSWVEGKWIKAATRGAIAALGHWCLRTVALPLAAHIFVQSDRMLEAASREYGVDPLKVTAVPMGVDLERFSTDTISPADDPLYQGKRIVLYLGTLDPSRRLDVPARGAALAMRDCPDLLFVAIGNASERERSALLDVFEAEGVSDRVLFRDRMPLREALSHVRRADVCLSAVPDTHLFNASTPTKLCEYLAMGRQVVANHLPDHDAVVTGTGIGTLTDYDALSFRDGILRALSLGEPTSEAVSAARHWIEEHRDYADISRKVSEVYKKILAAWVR